MNTIKSLAAATLVLAGLSAAMPAQAALNTSSTAPKSIQLKAAEFEKNAKVQNITPNRWGGRGWGGRGWGRGWGGGWGGWGGWGFPGFYGGWGFPWFGYGGWGGGCGGCGWW